MNSHSDGDTDDPNWLFAADNSNVRIGDFNGDGRSDILRWDSKEDMSHLDADHLQVDVWFGMGLTGAFQRSYIYLDADADYRKTSSDNLFEESFVDIKQEQIQVGDFNGDGLDDFAVIDGHDYIVYLSHSARIEVDQFDKPTTIRHNTALFSQNTFTDEHVNLNSPDLITIADFNNDNKDDIALWNGLPYILYSTSGVSDEENNSELTFIGIDHQKTMAENGVIGQYFSGYRSDYQKMKSADFSGDGVPDLLLIPAPQAEATKNAIIYITPPYNPVSLPEKPDKAITFDNVNVMQGITHKEKQFAFFGEDNQIKYIYRDEAGWHYDKDNNKHTLPLYDKGNDPRCDNDKPENSAFWQESVYTGVATSDPSLDHYIQPVCEAAYQGENFDVVSDGQYIYLFRGHGKGNEAKVLVERFDFSEADSKLIRLRESRFPLSGKRYVNTHANEIITEANELQDFSDSGALSTVDRSGEPFFEPAFKVPFALSEISNNPDCWVNGLTVSLANEGEGRQRFMLTTNVGNECHTDDKAGTIWLTSIRKGSDQVFATTNLSYLDEQGDKALSLWSYGIRLPYAARKLDSVVIDTTAGVIQADGEESDTVLDTEYVLSISYPGQANELETAVIHYPLDNNGFFKNTTDRPVYYTKQLMVDTGATTSPRFYSGSDGLTRLYWRGRNAALGRYNMLLEAVLDPQVTRVNGHLKTNWGEHSGQSVRGMTFADSWPFPHDEQSIQQTLTTPRNLPENIAPKWTPKYGTYYHSGDTTISHGIAPLVFENSRLTNKYNQKAGILVREFIELHKKQDGKYRVAFSETPLLELEAIHDARVTLNSTPIGFIEGAPPVPRENLGRDQNGRWGYSGELAEVELTIESGTTVSTEARDSGGITASGRLTIGGKSAFIEISTDFITNLKSGAFSGRDENYTLEEAISRKSFVTGSVPNRECQSEGEDKESPYLDTCYTLNPDGSKAIELWAPHTEGVIFTSTLSVSRFALRNPDDGKLVGYALDYSDASVQEQALTVKLDPNYQVAGSLDGHIGKDQLPNDHKGYFNPRQENNWLLQNTRQQQELEQRYYDVRTNSINESAQDYVNDKLLIADVAVTDGAYKSKSAVAAASITDYYGYEIETDTSATFNFENPPTGAGFGAGVGGYYSRNFQQGQTTNQSNEFSATIDHAVTSEVQDENNNTLPYTVDSYNSRSYFLPASEGNFEDLFDYVIAPELLEGDDYHESDRETVKTLRLIRSKPNPMWRIVHRVDGVSRYYPDPMSEN